MYYPSLTACDVLASVSMSCERALAAWRPAAGAAGAFGLDGGTSSSNGSVSGSFTDLHGYRPRYMTTISHDSKCCSELLPNQPHHLSLSSSTFAPSESGGCAPTLRFRLTSSFPRGYLSYNVLSKNASMVSLVSRKPCAFISKCLDGLRARRKKKRSSFPASGDEFSLHDCFSEVNLPYRPIEDLCARAFAPRMTQRWISRPTVSHSL